IIRGDFGSAAGVTLSLAAGVLVGAPMGARLSRRVGGPMIIRLLALALAVVGVRLLMSQLPF
ncbi:MAG: sulfite exporter TauE/SafE family protein, partial [Candidatus Dormibacteraceae bacterium]